MRFVVVTHVDHVFQDNHYYAYGPYVREMNIWFKQVDEVIIIAPLRALEKINFATECGRSMALISPWVAGVEVPPQQFMAGLFGAGVFALATAFAWNGISLAEIIRRAEDSIARAAARHEPPGS